VMLCSLQFQLASISDIETALGSYSPLEPLWWFSAFFPFFLGLLSQTPLLKFSRRIPLKIVRILSKASSQIAAVVGLAFRFYFYYSESANMVPSWAWSSFSLLLLWKTSQILWSFS
jgi:hypothetical protein